jgi:hypothetical protein
VLLGGHTASFLGFQTVKGQCRRRMCLTFAQVASMGSSLGCTWEGTALRSPPSLAAIHVPVLVEVEVIVDYDFAGRKRRHQALGHELEKNLLLHSHP